MLEAKSDTKAARDELSYLRGRIDTMPTKKKLVALAIIVFIVANVIQHFGF